MAKKKSVWNQPISRRSFIKGAAVAGGAMMLPAIPPFVKQGHAFAVSQPLRKFIQPMPLFGANIPLAAPSASPYLGVDYYRLTAGVFRQQLHEALPNPTRLYGFKDEFGTYCHLGAPILATKDRPVRYSFTSALPERHILPYDTSIPSPGNGGSRQDRSAVHLHGGLVPWPSDGGPFHWQSNPANPGGLQYGASVKPWLWDGAMDPLTGAPNANSLVWDYFYPNHQSSRIMWYHDHAIGQTRTNAYAGVASGYLVTGPDEASLGLPFADPIVFQDKVFWDPISDPSYANFAFNAVPGDLWYPWFYDPAIWPVAKGGIPPIPSAIPEFFGDTMLANGVVYPFHQVDQGMHRFRLLNACNARFLDLSFVMDAGNGEPAVGRNGAPVAANVDVWMIGTEGGFLPTPVQIVAAGVPLQPFVLGNAERADIIVRFNAPGNVILYNVAGAPFPGGAPIFDWFPGNKALALPPQPGFGPNTRTLMQFRVAPLAVPVSFPLPTAAQLGAVAPQIPTAPDPVNGGLMVDTTRLAAMLPGYTYNAAQLPEEVTLNEVVEPATFSNAGNTGRLQTLLGNRAGVALLPFGPLGTYYEQPATEFVQYNTIRIWKIYNNTVDAHPMHFHLFSVQILGRQKVNKSFVPTGKVRLPLPSEMGLKETIVAYPGEVTTVAALVEDPLPAGVYGRDAAGRPQVPVTVSTAAGPVTVQCTVPASERLAAAPYNLTNADEYVWHCHILEHEEHDMMRPLVARY